MGFHVETICDAEPVESLRLARNNCDCQTAGPTPISQNDAHPRPERAQHQLVVELRVDEDGLAVRGVLVRHPVMRSLELRARLADRHQAQGFLVHGKCQYPLHLGIIECADHDGPEIERDGLQMDVLRGVPDLHVHIAFRPLLVFPGGSLVNRGDDNGCRRIVQPVLFQCRGSQLRSLVPLDHRDQIVALRPIPVNASGQLILATRYEKKPPAGRARRPKEPCACLPGR